MSKRERDHNQLKRKWFIISFAISAFDSGIIFIQIIDMTMRTLRRINQAFVTFVVWAISIYKAP